jgi:hypothetical protein
VGIIHDDPAALKALQDSIYREKDLRARRLSLSERLADVCEVSNYMFGMMHGGAMARRETLTNRRVGAR